MSLVTSSLWVRRGLVKRKPQKVKYTKEEVLKAGQVGTDPDNELNKAEKASPEPEDNNPGQEAGIADEEDEYDFEHYEEESDNDSEDGDTLSNMEESESEDEEINENDNLIVVGCFENDMEIVKVYVYNEVDDDLYVHHDIMVTSCPLCVEYIRTDMEVAQNVIAVGGMSSVIELWDLDVIDNLDPIMFLGRAKGKRKKKKLSHNDAVVDLSWNTQLPHILASGSVDKSILLWDLAACRATNVLTKFPDEVECVEWHPAEGQTLFSSSADKMVSVFDCRYDDTLKQWASDEKIICGKWNPLNLTQLVCGSADGSLVCIDSRCDDFVWKVDTGHKAEIVGVSVLQEYPGLIASASADGFVQLWQASDSLTLLFEKSVKVGKLCSFATNPDAPYICCVGGDKKSNNFKILNLKDLDGLIQYWSPDDTSAV